MRKITNLEHLRGDVVELRQKIAALETHYRPMVQVDGEWAGNALVFATREEAEANVKALAWRWLAVTDTRVDETDAPVNYRFVDGKLERLVLT